MSALTDIQDGWFDALGHPVAEASATAALRLLAENGCDAGEASMVLTIVCREIAHDEPERAQRTLRGWLPPHGSETILWMTLATLCVPGQCPTCQHEHRDGTAHRCLCPDCGSTKHDGGCRA